MNDKRTLEVITIIISISALLFSIITYLNQKKLENFEIKPNFMNIIDMKYDGGKKLVSYKIVNESNVKLKKFESKEYPFLIEGEKLMHKSKYLYNFYPISERFFMSESLTGYTKDVIKNTELSSCLYSDISTKTHFFNDLQWADEKSGVASYVLNDLILVSKIQYQTYNSDSNMYAYLLSTRTTSFEISKEEFEIFRKAFEETMYNYYTYHDQKNLVTYNLTDTAKENVYMQLHETILKNKKTAIKLFEQELNDNSIERKTFNSFGKRIYNSLNYRLIRTEDNETISQSKKITQFDSNIFNYK